MSTAEPAAVTAQLAWFKSSYSGAEGGDCVEVAAGAGVVHLRDSKDAGGPVVRISAAAWDGFLGDV
jgi:hypothetical protein